MQSPIHISIRKIWGQWKKMQAFGSMKYSSCQEPIIFYHTDLIYMDTEYFDPADSFPVIFGQHSANKSFGFWLDVSWKD